ncbi:hypothetical protein Tco_0800014 [Tanacetum coccineum]|uniref:Reverse transcriptase domain-containing protein n=1 Tax=Tanacetum coccineum TaxID=301880 RepID=A0ABQ4ZUL6_9ASTR
MGLINLVQNKKGLWHDRRSSCPHPIFQQDHFYDEVPNVPSLSGQENQSPAPTPVKAVEESCVTCGGAHSYQTCPTTSGNVYRDNIQEYVSQAAAANFNQGNTGYRAPISNQIRPPGFPPEFVKNKSCIIDVYEGEITLRVGREAITFNLDQTSRILSRSSWFLKCDPEWQSHSLLCSFPSLLLLTLTPFGDSNFLLFEEADSFLALEDDPTSPEVDPTYYDPEGDILLLEAILNSEARS